MTNTQPSPSELNRTPEQDHSPLHLATDITYSHWKSLHAETLDKLRWATSFEDFGSKSAIGKTELKRFKDELRKSRDPEVELGRSDRCKAERGDYEIVEGLVDYVLENMK
ncbi:hypothetical protein I302_108733 [Kwoniella bestiolae CBS 10118]|uniref:Uncharacterized protein n=1 Tax=Kwoniella bestiolae CBS 10118 TaxID=1296100 RepID=A0A1B9FTX4_9TREE|nr:hypothetical protein I302_07870 [Kwoniella bestiolae CBS 10118]OCF22225.1 hypothetical protein I302_07870 [Kwoniella bestiolae CBS 10118]